MITISQRFFIVYNNIKQNFNRIGVKRLKRVVAFNVRYRYCRTANCTNYQRNRCQRTLWSCNLTFSLILFSVISFAWFHSAWSNPTAASKLNRRENELLIRDTDYQWNVFSPNLQFLRTFNPFFTKPKKNSRESFPTSRHLLKEREIRKTRKILEIVHRNLLISLQNSIQKYSGVQSELAKIDNNSEEFCFFSYEIAVRTFLRW